MESETRNLLRNTVTACRRLLEQAVGQRLEGEYGLHVNGTIEDAAKLAHLSAEDAAYRGQLVDHYRHIAAAGIKPGDAMAQLVREIAFTHLNRLCAYKMMERRGLIREAVSRGAKSQGFMFYLADHPEDQALWSGGQADRAYRHYLNGLGATFADEIPALFSPHDAANRLYPPQRVLDEVLELINAQALDGIWAEDEAIGWVYQYFTPKELREQARRESAAPRNSYELAFRNQFYTPRYVVEFLTDNTLGRIWYEMRQGQTSLAECCRYLVRRPHEVFMAPDEAPPAQPEIEDISQEELLQQPVYIPYRAPKDPRHITMLDPAGGSGHFALYCFDLYEVIYREAYDAPDLGADLRRDHPDREAFLRAVPALILEHNLHLIDIDPRACQIAALALWLRAQRAYEELAIRRDERPRITRAHVVCAEPMPGDARLLEEYLLTVDARLRPLVRQIWEKMQLAGEAGSLLKIEDEIYAALREGRTAALVDVPPVQMTFYQADQPPRQMVLELVTADERAFWERAEDELLAALRDYVRHATNGQGLRRQLFAEDAAQGLAFIDLCRQRYDAVLMNPPFGEVPNSSIEYIAERYLSWNKNVLCAFAERGWGMSAALGTVGIIYDRTANVKTTYQDFRRSVLTADDRLYAVADLGWEVLDANVEVTTSVMHHGFTDCAAFIDVRAQAPDIKGSSIQSAVSGLMAADASASPVLEKGTSFGRLPNAVISYDMPKFLIHALKTHLSIKETGLQAYTGAQIRAEQHFRLFWECLPSGFGPTLDFCYMYNGGEYARFYLPPRDVALYGDQGSKIDEKDPSYSWRVQSRHAYFKSGVGFGVRGEFLDAHYLRLGYLFTVEGQSIPVPDEGDKWLLLGLLNSVAYQVALNSYCGQHKYSGYVNLLPFPKASPSHLASNIAGLARESYSLLEEWYSHDQTTLIFSGIPWILRGEREKGLQYLLHGRKQAETKVNRQLNSWYHELNTHVLEMLAVSSDVDLALVRAASRKLEQPQLPPADSRNDLEDLVGYAIGALWGMWDIRIVLDPSLQRPLAAPPQEYPTLPPGVLQGYGTHRFCDDDYPLAVNSGGILVDDPDHPEDIVRRTREVLSLLWGERAGTIEQEACEILGVAELRDYFRKPAKGGFWDDHVKRYSKSRRKAPIYWLLQSSKKNYALWLYYHRLDGDILFKALVNDVEPKVRLEESRLEGLRGELHASGATGAEARRLEREIVRQEAFVSELMDFRDKLHRAADLRLTPDLNDGVVLNIAPLWELVPWKVAKEYWDALLAGQYEWSSIGKQLREKGMVK